MELTVVEQNGWKKPYQFDKAVLRIGSATANDIVLSSPGISPIHVQVMCAPETPGSCKVLNLGPAVQWKSGGKESPIESYVSVDARDGDELILAGYRILFHLPLSAGMIMSSRQIAAFLLMKDAVLRSDIPATGFLRLKNLGTNPNCQFQVAVNGLPEECFQVDPPPTLYPNAEEDVRIQFFHRSTTPPAGQQVITISVTAPTTYPGERVIIQQGLYVSPVLKAEINLVDDMPVAKAKSAAPALVPEVSANALAPTAEETEKPQMAPKEMETSLPKTDAPILVAPAEKAEELPAAPPADDKPLSKVSVSDPLPAPEVKVEPRKPKMKPSIVVSSPPDDSNESLVIPPPAPQESAIPVQKDVFATKIVRNPSETYWDDKS